MLSDSGDVVLDPFSGRGTTLLEARLRGRMPLASDLNQLASALTNAKNVVVSADAVLARIAELEARFDSRLYLPEAQAQPDKIQLLYHVQTLAQLCFLRRRLLASQAAADVFLVGTVLGILHGAMRQDGTSAYASISMPNTFSMSPAYVRRYIAANHLQRLQRNVFQLLREKVERLFRNGVPSSTAGRTALVDVKNLTSEPLFSEYVGKVQLILTSPPYLDVVNYLKQNWIRAWFLDDTAGVDTTALDDHLTLGEWLRFIEDALWEMKGMLRSDGVAVLVIGDVAKAQSSVVSLARELIRLVNHREMFSYIGYLADYIDVDVKTTRIWGETKGKATTVDRIVVLADKEPVFRYAELSSLSLGHALPDQLRFDPIRLQKEALSFAG